MEILSNSVFHGETTFKKNVIFEDTEIHRSYVEFSNGGRVAFTSQVDFSSETCVHFSNGLETDRLYLNSDYIRVFCSCTGSSNNYYLSGGGDIAIVGSTSPIISSFTNETIPSGCKKFTVSHSKLVPFGYFNFDSSKPHIIQIRKTSTGETMDMLVNISGSIQTVSSEFTFERASIDEIPANYFKTTIIGYR